MLKQIVSFQLRAQDAREAFRSRLQGDRGSVSTIAGIAALTIGVLAAAAIVVGVMTDHAKAIPGP